jgi:hypothetical protein
MLALWLGGTTELLRSASEVDLFHLRDRHLLEAHCTGGWSVVASHSNPQVSHFQTLRATMLIKMQVYSCRAMQVNSRFVQCLRFLQKCFAKKGKQAQAGVFAKRLIRN